MGFRNLAMLDARRCLGSHDVLLVTLDTLRYDVAADTLARGTTPNLGRLLPGGVWERRHSPGNFTYAAHQAFFAGFLPTPIAPGRHSRLFAARFEGSETTSEATCLFEASNIVQGFAEAGYHTICVGGVGFFNKQNPLGSVLPGLFSESHWSTEFSVTHHDSTANQVACAVGALRRLPDSRRAFLFLNVSALHQPNCHYLANAAEDSIASHAAALDYVDACIPPLFDALRRRGPALCVICSDHGTAYGEDGYWGHRVSHPVVWNVPYAEFILDPEGGNDS
jgi:hypothetical protein